MKTATNAENKTKRVNSFNGKESLNMIQGSSFIKYCHPNYWLVAIVLRTIWSTNTWSENREAAEGEYEYFKNMDKYI